MSESQPEKKKSRPWYLTWRAIPAFLAVNLLLILIIPSEERVASKRADKVYDYCTDERAKRRDGELSESDLQTCSCVRDVFKKELLDGADPKSFTGFGYATVEYACSMDALYKDIETLTPRTVEDLCGDACNDNPELRKRMEAILNETSVQSTTNAQSTSRRPTQTPSKPSIGIHGRIEQGDYVWSDSFIYEEVALFRYSVALRQAFSEQCPAAITPEEEAQIDYFLGALKGSEVIAVMQGRKPLNVEEALAAAIADPAILATSRSQLQNLVKEHSCSGPQVQGAADNVARMLSGRRPVYGANIARSTLVVEKEVPVEQKHAYDDTGDVALTSRGARQLDRDYREANRRGLTVIECHYDEKPNDEYYDVQYYWGISPLATLGFQIPDFGNGFQSVAQRNLTRANGREYTHPFTTFGSPRLECPARLDPAMGSKRIYAPRPDVDVPPSDMPVPTDPEIVTKRAFTLYDYGQSPENFVPPIPEDLPKNTLHLVMDKNAAGSLSAIEVQNFGPWSLTREYPNGSEMQNMLNEDLSAISKEKPRVIVCKYLSERRDVTNVSRHWYQSEPKAADPDRLRSRMPDHPVLVISGVRETCSASYDQ